MNTDLTWLIPPLLFIVALLYSSVGHGGASGYLALLALFGYGQSSIRSSALMLNLVVSLLSFIHFYRAGYFRWKLFYPFAISSVPAAFVGALIPLKDSLYHQILGILLIFPILRLSGLFGKEPEEIKAPNFWLSVLIGGIIGLMSGMISLTRSLIAVAHCRNTWSAMSESSR